MPILFILLVTTSILNATPSLPEITVRGTQDAGNNHTIINSDTIIEKQYQNTQSLLNSHPSIEVKNSGGMTSLFMRGTSSNHNIVILNGLIVNDPSANNFFDFNNLNPNDIEKIEVITGAKALYYGSGALGGVIKITTKKATKGTNAKGRFEIGSFETRSIRTELSHRNSTAGFIAAINTGCSGAGKRYNHHHQVHNADFQNSSSASLFLDLKTSPYHDFELYIQTAKKKQNLDDFINGKLRATGDRSFKYNNSIALKNTLTLLDGKWQQNVTLGLQNNRRKTISNNTRTFIAKRESVDYETTFDLTNWITINGGLNYSRELDHSHHIPQKTFDTKSIRTKVNFDPSETLEFFISARLDKHEKFSVHPTWQTGASWNILENTTIESSLGKGFKAPSIQTFVGSNTLQNPNTNAKPEKSFLWDISLKQTFLKKKLTAKLTYFINKIKDILVWDSSQRMLINKNQRSIRGIEFFLNHKINNKYNITASLTYLRAFDQEPAMRALSIPIYKTSFGFDYTATKKLSFFTEVVHKSRQMNYNNKRINAVTSVRLGGKYQLNKQCNFFGRIENALNQKIEESYGYGRRGLGIFMGVTLKT